MILILSKSINKSNILIIRKYFVLLASKGRTGSSLEQSWMPCDALDGLEEYSHCWIIFHFHLNDPGNYFINIYDTFSVYIYYIKIYIDIIEMIIFNYYFELYIFLVLVVFQDIY